MPAMKSISINLNRVLIVLISTGFYAGKASVFSAETSVPSTPSQALHLPEAVAVDRMGEIRQLWTEGKKSEAQGKISEWIKKEKKNVLPWVLKTEFAFKDGRYKQALSLAEKALSKFPPDERLYFLRGQSYEALKNPMDAANEYRAALLLNKSNAEAQMALNKLMVTLDPSSVSVVSPSTEESH